MPIEEYTMPPIHQAVEDGNLTEVQSLLASNPSLVHSPISETEPDQPLHLAAWQGHAEILQLLLQAGADINARGDSEFTPLHYAAKEGKYPEAELLVESGADLNLKDNVGWTPLLRAARGRNFTCRDVAILLLQKGAEPDLNSLVSLALVKAVCSRVQSDPGAIRRAVAPKDLVDDAVIAIGSRILDEADDEDSLEEQERIVEKYQSLVTCLVAAGADINAVSSAGMTPLFTAVGSGEVPLIRLLLEQGADPNFRLQKGARWDDVFTYQGRPEVSGLRALLEEFGYTGS